MSESIERHITTVTTSEGGTVVTPGLRIPACALAPPVIVSTPNVAATSMKGH